MRRLFNIMPIYFILVTSVVTVPPKFRTAGDFFFLRSIVPRMISQYFI